MNCDELTSVLSLDDVDARIASAAAREHLDGCPACSSRWPEVALLLTAGRTTRVAVGYRRRVIAAGIAAVALVGLALHSASPIPALPPIPDASAPIRAIACSSLTQETIELDHGHRFASRVTETTWTAPTPKCLQVKGAGS